MKKIGIIATAIFVATACTGIRGTAHMKVMPLASEINPNSLTVGTVAVAFTANDFNWTSRTLTCDIFSKCLYDSTEVEQLQVGDTLVYEGKSMAITSIESQKSNKIINGGIETGGAELTPNGNGTYRTVLMDDHSVYEKLGRQRLSLADDFIITDCGEDYSDPYDTIRTNHKAYIDSLPEYRRDYFNCLNTEIVMSEGKVKEIHRRWIP